MKSKDKVNQETVKSHFIKRAGKYDRSSNWVNDPRLLEKIIDLAEPSSDALVLDIATGTGKICEYFYRKVNYVVGIDICRQIVQQARNYADEIVLSAAEKLPFKDNYFDICVCRQGLQFMEVNEALSEINRVLKAEGRIVLCHLTAYEKRDKQTTFLIQSLRNPARKNFFLPEDFQKLLERNGFADIESFEYITRESVNQWIDNGAIDKDLMEKIKRVYRNAPDDFIRIHNIELKDDDILDSMKMVIMRARKRNNCLK